jgi:cell division transport system permease protein
MKNHSFKRRLINAKRVFAAGLKSFFRNAWLSVAATIVMTITLISILVTSFASYTLNNTVETFTAKIDVSIFFKTEASKDEIDQFSNDLRNNQELGVREVTYISKEAARKGFEEQNKDDIKTLQAIAQTKDAFPASIRVKTLDTDNLEKVVEVAREQQYSSFVDKDSYKDDAKRTAVDRLGNIAKFLRTGGLVASIVFGAISILVVFNTIRMTIFNRKDEIEIMQLIGASKWFIRGPFLVEASIYGVIAATLSLSFFYFAVLGQAPKLGSYVEEIQPTIDQFREWSLPIMGIMMLSGIIIGSFSAYLAIRKHLRLNHTK